MASKNYSHKIPSGWEFLELQKLSITLTGNTPSKKESKNYGDFIPFVKPPELQECIITTAKDNLSEFGSKSARILPKNSILVTCIGNLGRIGLNSIPVAFNQQINAILPNKSFYSKFLFYQAQSVFF